MTACRLQSQAIPNHAAPTQDGSGRQPGLRTRPRQRRPAHGRRCRRTRPPRHASGKFNIRVYASARGYENPNTIYPRRQTLGHADIRRFPFASFGKKSMALRILGTAAFMIQAFFAALFTPRLAGIFFSTSPPLIGLPMSIAAAFRRVPTAIGPWTSTPTSSSPSENSNPPA